MQRTKATKKPQTHSLKHEGNTVQPIKETGKTKRETLTQSKDKSKMNTPTLFLSVKIASGTRQPEPFKEDAKVALCPGLNNLNHRESPRLDSTKAIIVTCSPKEILG